MFGKRWHIDLAGKWGVAFNFNDWVRRNVFRLSDWVFRDRGRWPFIFQSSRSPREVSVGITVARGGEITAGGASYTFLHLGGVFSGYFSLHTFSHLYPSYIITGRGLANRAIFLTHDFYFLVNLG